MASPPETNVLKVPADFLMVAMLEPRPSTVDSSLSHLAPVTVLSAVTRILFVFGSTAQEVPGMVALVFRVCAPASSSGEACWLDLADLLRAGRLLPGAAR
ncbi:hypothetical protein SALBM311S_00071 [Streptomyces alboniger]